LYNILDYPVLTADPGGLAIYEVDVRPLSGWDCGFESRRGHGSLSFVIAVCLQLDIFVPG
jgi:hypothetical protein